MLVGSMSIVPAAGSVKPVDSASVDPIRNRVTAEFNGSVGREFQPDGWSAICALAQLH
jgi:hypothetical protein